MFHGNHLHLNALDWAAVGANLAIVLGWLPTSLQGATTVLSFLYLLVRFLETKTVQRWLKRK